MLFSDHPFLSVFLKARDPQVGSLASQLYSSLLQVIFHNIFVSLSITVVEIIWYPVI